MLDTILSHVLDLSWNCFWVIQYVRKSSNKKIFCIATTHESNHCHNASFCCSCTSENANQQRQQAPDLEVLTQHKKLDNPFFTHWVMPWGSWKRVSTSNWVSFCWSHRKKHEWRKIILLETTLSCRWKAVTCTQSSENYWKKANLTFAEGNIIVSKELDWFLRCITGRWTIVTHLLDMDIISMDAR